MYSIDYLYWNFIGNLLDRDFELVQAPASFGEAWLEARGSAPYDLVRVFGRISISDRISSVTWNLFMKERSA